MHRLVVIVVLSTPFAAWDVRGPARAAVATSLSSFEGREEPTVLYHPSDGSFTNDNYVNITDQGGGVIRYSLRYQPNQDWWDGDRSTTNDDRQRAEVKGLGAHQKTNQTFRYTFDWRTDPNYIGVNSFCHIFQLKSTDGDSGAPLVTLSLGTNGNGTLRIWSGSAGNSSTARSFQWTPNTWSRADIVITTSTGNTGSVIASINGDPFAGVTNVPVYRPDATDYRPKWGLYRGIHSGLYVGTNWVEDRAVTANQLAANDLIWNPTPSGDTAWNTTDANNWIKSGVPGAFVAGSNVHFSNTGAGNVIIDAAGVSPAAVYVDAESSYRFGGGPIRGAASLTKTGSGTLLLANTNTYTGLTTVAGGTLAVSGLITGPVQVHAGATLQGSGGLGGAVQVFSGGVLAPGSSTGKASLDSLALTTGATLKIELGGALSDSHYDRLQVAGSLTLAGALEVSLVNNFTPAVGDSFDILDWTTISGSFQSIVLPTLADSLAWDAERLDTDGILAVTSNLPGDFDQNGTVDSADYVVWRKTGGTQQGYDTWRANFGRTAGSPAGAAAPAAVPEPVTYILLPAALCTLRFPRRQWASHR